LQILRKSFSEIGQSDETPENAHGRAALQVQILRKVVFHFVESAKTRQEHSQQRKTI